MASFSKRGDQTLAQVRVKRGGVIVFSQSQMFADENEARLWADKLEKRVKKEGIPDVVRTSNFSVGELIRMHLKYQRNLRPLGRSTIQNHDYMAQEFDKIALPDLRAKHLVDFATRRRNIDKVSPATILSNLSPLSAAIHAAKYAHEIRVDPTEVDIAMKRLTDMGLVAKSRQVERLVDQEEEDAPRARSTPIKARIITSNATASACSVLCHSEPPSSV